MYTNIKLEEPKENGQFNIYVEKIAQGVSNKNEAIALLEFELLFKPFKHRKYKMEKDQFITEFLNSALANSRNENTHA